MAVMVLSPRSRQVYDPIRRKWVDATPEEEVRQRLLLLLVEHLGYPKHCIAVEKNISEVVVDTPVPNRRLDILCFESQTLKPLLLIECKAVPIHRKMLSQVMGYNAYIGAPVICLANQETIILGWENQELEKEALPKYSELVDAYL